MVGAVPFLTQREGASKVAAQFARAGSIAVDKSVV